MNLDHPTTTFYFVFALTNCRLQVYNNQAEFAKQVLIAARVEWLEEKDCPTWNDFDTRVWTDVVVKHIAQVTAEGVTEYLKSSLFKTQF